MAAYGKGPGGRKKKGGATGQSKGEFKKKSVKKTVSKPTPTPRAKYNNNRTFATLKPTTKAGKKVMKDAAKATKAKRKAVKAATDLGMKKGDYTKSDMRTLAKSRGQKAKAGAKAYKAIKKAGGEKKELKHKMKKKYGARRK